jgi:mannose-6-phosphate isomerase-like protein (cupin superfamily)
MNPAILRFNPAGEYATPENCRVLEHSNSDADPGLSIARARVAPGEITRWHVLEGTAERYLILEGRGRIELDKLPPRDVGPGDAVLIPPGCPQRIRNTGGGDLVFLALCTPRFLPENYRDTDAA